MASKADSITKDFNHSAVGSVLKFAVQTIVIGIIVGGVIDFSLFHNHPLGQAILGVFNEPLLSFYDGIAHFLGMDNLARSAEFISQGAPMLGANAGANAAAVAGTGSAGAAATLAPKLGQACSTIDPATFMPMPC